MRKPAGRSNLLRCEEGVSSIEYAILASMIIAVCVLAIQLLGIETKGLFERITALWK